MLNKDTIIVSYTFFRKVIERGFSPPQINMSCVAFFLFHNSSIRCSTVFGVVTIVAGVSFLLPVPSMGSYSLVSVRVLRFVRWWTDGWIRGSALYSSFFLSLMLKQ